MTKKNDFQLWKNQSDLVLFIERRKSSILTQSQFFNKLWIVITLYEFKFIYKKKILIKFGVAKANKFLIKFGISKANKFLI